MPSSPKKFRSKIKSKNQLSGIVKKLIHSGKNVVFTNGVFDILHKGHVTYLEQARNLGDVLVVALNSDASTRRLKGQLRPINTLADRLEVIAALESVDYVSWFGENTPLKLILRVKPNVLVKGGDWSIEQMVGAKEVLSWGGEVKSLPYLKGKSTTGIIRKARLRGVS